MQRYRAHLAKYDQLIRLAIQRQKAQAYTPDLIPTLIEQHRFAIAQNMFDTHYDRDDTARLWLCSSAYRYIPYGFWDDATESLGGPAVPRLPNLKLRELLPALLTQWRELIALGDEEGIIEAEGQAAEDLLSDHNITVENGNPPFALCLALLNADIESVESLIGRLAGKVAIEPPRPLTTPTKSPTAMPPVLSMQDMADCLLKSPTPPSEPTAQKWRTALRFWREVHGDIAHTAITTRHVTEWLDLLLQRPARFPHVDRGLPLKALIEKYKNSGLTTLNSNTVASHVGILNSIWGKGIQRGDIEMAGSPFAKRAAQVAHSTGGQPLTIDQINATLALPVFTAGYRPTRGRGEAAYWIPLFLITTGARPGEVAQLIVSDFWQTADGMWMMKYIDEGDHPQSGPRHLKTSIHGTGKREFPIPQALIDLNFIAYIKQLLDSGEVALFPRLTNTTKGLFAGWARWWIEYNNECQILKEGQRPSREFRHGWPTFARQSGISDDAISYIMGHSTGTMTSRYGSSVSRGLEMTNVRFDGVDFAQVQPWQAP